MRAGLIAGTLAISLIAIGTLQAQQQRLPVECRKDVIQLCGNDRSNMRSCIRERVSELSESCRTELKQRMETQRETGVMAQRRGGEDEAGVRRSGVQELSYGSAPLQNANFWAGRGNNAPLVLFVHGGGWKRGDKSMVSGSAKLTHWQDAGYAVASINYRLVPDATVEQQASDVATSVAYFRTNAVKFGIDPKRIILIGHSAGAHLVALVGTDPQWLAGAGLAQSDLQGVIPLDGAAYDVAAQMGENARILGDTYEQAFGTDPVRQAALSPTRHAEAPNAPAFLILHVDREDGTRQSEALAAALQAAGTDVQIARIPGRGLKGHMEINRKLGEADYPATPLVDKFLRDRFGR